MNWSRFSLLFFSILLLAGSAFAQGTSSCATLDFETVPGETAAEGVLVDMQFEQSLGMSFALEDGNVPRLAEVGSPTTAF